MRYTAMRVGCQLAILLGPAACLGAEGGGDARPPMPALRIETDGFDAREADIRAVLESACRELWRFFPDYKIEPIVVTRGRQGPITLYRRNDRGEIVMRLDTGGTYWSQYAYQFSHEFCHVLCGFQDAYQGNKWFEETLCETASLFAMRAMSRAWKDSPPFVNWRDYRDALRDYVDDVIRKRDKFHEICGTGLPGFYLAHRKTLEGQPASRELNGAMSVVLLHLFEEQPQRWEAVRWLNTPPSREGETLAVYFQKWRDAVPERHRGLVEKVAGLYGAAVGPKAPAASQSK